VATDQHAAIDRRERLRQLALETIDLSKDPYFMKNHLGSYECKLCLTLHNNEGNYLAHTQGKRHQTNLTRRGKFSKINSLFLGGLSINFLITAAREAKDNPFAMAPQIQIKKKIIVPLRGMPKIGRPGYKVTKQRDPVNGQKSLTFEIKYPQIREGVQPRHRLMSAFEQRIEPADKNFQYLLFAAEPYETVAFKIPAWELERGSGGGGPEDAKYFPTWDRDTLTFTVRF